MGVVAGTQQTSGSTNFIRLHVVGALEQRAERRKSGRSASLLRGRKQQ
jgi:hypothetical protein